MFPAEIALCHQVIKTKPVFISIPILKIKYNHYIFYVIDKSVSFLSIGMMGKLNLFVSACQLISP